MHDHGCTDTHTLIHSTRKFKRVTVQYTVSVLQTDFFHKGSGTLTCFFYCYFLMFGYCFMDLHANCPYRTQGRLTVLKYHTDLCPQIFAEIFLTHLCKILSFIPDIASGNHTFFSQKAHDRLDDRTFSTAGLSHDSKDFPLFQFKTDITDYLFSIITDSHMLYTK